MSTNKTMRLSGKKLSRGFYLRPTLDVARDLMRKTIVYHTGKYLLAGDIVEVEAYIGENDPACHAAPGRTARNSVMYGPGGFSYIYFIYGMYHCFNIVTEKKEFPAAVLVRAVEPIAGIENMHYRPHTPSKKIANGPGKFCRAFGLTRMQNGLDLTGSELYIIDRSLESPKVGVSKRIGIRKGTDKQWRFFDMNSDCVSR